MRIRFGFCLALLLALPVLPSSAQNDNPTPDLPPIVTAGLDAYRNVGIEQAFRAWLRNSPLHWDPALAAPLHQAQEAFGPFESWEVIDVRAYSPRTRVAYLVLDYQQGPVFAKFIAYNTGSQGWVVTTLKFSMEDDAILPPQPL